MVPVRRIHPTALSLVTIASSAYAGFSRVHPAVPFLATAAMASTEGALVYAGKKAAQNTLDDLARGGSVPVTVPDEATYKDLQTRAPAFTQEAYRTLEAIAGASVPLAVARQGIMTGFGCLVAYVAGDIARTVLER